MPDGSLSAAKFRVFQWPVAEAPGGVRIFACQHKTRETVWIPELMRHANAAKRLRQALIVTPEPAKDAAHLSRMIDRDVTARGRRRRHRAFGRRSRRFRLSDQGPACGGAIPAFRCAGLPERGGAGLVLASGDLAATGTALGAAGIRSGHAICVARHPPPGRCWCLSRPDKPTSAKIKGGLRRPSIPIIKRAPRPAALPAGRAGYRASR